MIGKALIIAAGITAIRFRSPNWQEYRRNRLLVSKSATCMDSFIGALEPNKPR